MTVIKDFTDFRSEDNELFNIHDVLDTIFQEIYDKAETIEAKASEVVKEAKDESKAS